MMNKFDLDRTDPPILPAGLRRIGDTRYCYAVHKLIAWRVKKAEYAAFETGDHGQEQIKGTGQRLPMVDSALTGKPMPRGIETAVPVPPTLTRTWVDTASPVHTLPAGVWRNTPPPELAIYWVRKNSGEPVQRMARPTGSGWGTGAWQWLDESPQPDADGWIAHTGDDCPVPAATLVMVRFEWGPSGPATITHYRTDQP